MLTDYPMQGRLPTSLCVRTMHIFGFWCHGICLAYANSVGVIGALLDRLGRHGLVPRAFL